MSDAFQPDFLKSTTLASPFCSLTVGVREKLDCLGFTEDQDCFPYNVMKRTFVTSLLCYRNVTVSWYSVVPNRLVLCKFTCDYYDGAQRIDSSEEWEAFNNLNDFVYAVLSIAYF